MKQIKQDKNDRLGNFFFLFLTKGTRTGSWIWLYRFRGDRRMAGSSLLLNYIRKGQRLWDPKPLESL